MNLDLLISIKPKYVDKIINGKKKYEYRKSIPRKAIKRIFIYSTFPKKKIVGYFDFKGYLQDNPRDLWNKTFSFSGISEEEFFAYFNSRKTAYAIIIERFYLFDQAIDPLDIMYNFVAPQSYKYINGDVII